MTTEATPIPRWIIWAAHAVPLVVLPSSLWRIAFGLGAPVGLGDPSFDEPNAPSWGLTSYVFALSLVGEFFALLTLGLIRPWGEVFARWIPFVGGRRVPTAFVVTVATVGGILITLISLQGIASFATPQSAGDWLLLVCYAPFIAWAPLLAVVTAHYYLRRRNGASRRHRSGARVAF